MVFSAPSPFPPDFPPPPPPPPPITLAPAAATMPTPPPPPTGHRKKEKISQLNTMQNIFFTKIKKRHVLKMNKNKIINFLGLGFAADKESIYGYFFLFIRSIFSILYQNGMGIAPYLLPRPLLLPSPARPPPPTRTTRTRPLRRPSSGRPNRSAPTGGGRRARRARTRWTSCRRTRTGTGNDLIIKMCKIGRKKTA